MGLVTMGRCSAISAHTSHTSHHIFLESSIHGLVKFSSIVDYPEIEGKTTYCNSNYASFYFVYQYTRVIK